MRDGATGPGIGRRLAAAAAFVIAATAAVIQPTMAANPGSSCALLCPGVSRKCVPSEAICNGIRDCANGEDELNSQCPLMDGRQCILTDSHYCNGVWDCLDGSDELNCGSTTPAAHIDFGSDWLWTWPLVGAVLCAIVCTSVALSLRYMRLKRQQREAARRRVAADAASAAARDAAAAGGLRLPSMTLPSYAEATSVPYAGAFSNLSYSLTPAELPPDYLEAVREAERLSVLEHQQKQQLQQQQRHHCTSDCGDCCGGGSSSSCGTSTPPESMLQADLLTDVPTVECMEGHPHQAAFFDVGMLSLQSPAQQTSSATAVAAAAAGSCSRDEAGPRVQPSEGAKFSPNGGGALPTCESGVPAPSYDTVVADNGVLFLSARATPPRVTSTTAEGVRRSNDQSAYLRYSMC